MGRNFVLPDRIHFRIKFYFEGRGIKREKYGVPDKAHLAKEIQDVLHAALQVAIFYSWRVPPYFLHKGSIHLAKFC